MSTVPKEKAESGLPRRLSRRSHRAKPDSPEAKAGKLGLILALATLLLAGFLAGCKSPESSENEASRPWNAPRQWETGLPGFNNYERR